MVETEESVNVQEDLQGLLEPDQKENLDEEETLVSVDADVFAKEGGVSTEPKEGVLEGLETLLDRGVPVVINSGKPIDYLRELRDDWQKRGFELGALDLVGGQGTYYELEGEVKPVFDDDEEYRDQFHDLHREIFDTAASKRWKLMLQNNRSLRAGVARIEAEGGNKASRGNTRENPAFSGISTQEQWEKHFEDMPGFEYRKKYDRQAGGEGAIALKYSWDDDLVGYLQHVMRREEPFVGNRFEFAEDGTMVFYRDEEDRSVSNVEETMEEAVRRSKADLKDVMHHSDGGTEFVLDHAGKGVGLENYMIDRFGHLVDAVHGGDGESDVLGSDWVLTAAQRGEDSHYACRQNGHSYTVVDDAADLARSFLSAAEATGYKH